MARPKADKSIELEALPLPSDIGIPTVKVLHLYAGLDLIGSKTSINNKTADLYERPNSILMVSKGTNRKVVIPFSNVKGYELI